MSTMGETRHGLLFHYARVQASKKTSISVQPQTDSKDRAKEERILHRWLNIFQEMPTVHASFHNNNKAATLHMLKLCKTLYEKNTKNELKNALDVLSHLIKGFEKSTENNLFQYLNNRRHNPDAKTRFRI